MRYLLLSLFYGMMAVESAGQNVGIGTPTPDGSAQMDIFSGTKGILIPRVSLSNVFLASPTTTPAEGLLVWNTNAATSNGSGKGFYYWNGSRWQKLANNTEGWNLTGNNNIDTALNFIGTTTNTGLMFRVGNQKAGGIFPIGGNTFLGKSAGQFVKFDSNNFTGEENTFIGSEAGATDSTATASTFIGSRTGVNAKGSFGNTFVGASAGAGSTTGTHNTAIGLGAGNSSTGSRNVSMGAEAGAVGPGNENVLLGYNVANFVQGGNGNVWIGSNAGTGNFGLFPKGISDNNVFIGDSAAFQTNGAQANVFIGKRSGMSSTTSKFNVFVGDSSGINNNSGSLNTFIGSKARGATGGIINATAVGANAQAAGSNVVVLGSIEGINGATESVNVGIGTANPQSKLHIVDLGSAGINPNTNSSLVLEKNGTANYINFLNANAESGILFGVAGAPAGAANGGVLYNNPGFRQGLNFRTGGNVNRMVIDSVGNVGIGTIAPQFRFTVSTNDAQNAGHRQGIMIENTAEGDANTGEAAINFRNVGTAGTGNNYWMAGLNQNRNFAFAYGNDFNVSATRMVIDSTGKIGMGTTAPDEKLEVVGNTRINGELYQGALNANMMPVCYGNILSSGTIQASTGNITSVTKVGIGIYDIVITSQSYTTSAFIVQITSTGSVARFATSSASGSALRISMFDAAGAAADGGFHFVMYKP